MRLALTEKDFEPIGIGIEKVLDKKKLLPEKVFREAFRYFLFITFDELLMPLFFNHIKQYLQEAGENSFWLTAIEPDPKLYFGSHFNFFGAVEFSTSDTEDDYLIALNNYPVNSPADALAHNSNLLTVFSSTNRWAIYGDRNTDTAICAFSDETQMELFKSIYGSDILGGVKAAAEYAYGASSKNAQKDKFCKNYSVD